MRKIDLIKEGLEDYYNYDDYDDYDDYYDYDIYDDEKMLFLDLLSVVKIKTNCESIIIYVSKLNHTNIKNYFIGSILKLINCGNYYISFSLPSIDKNYIKIETNFYLSNIPLIKIDDLWFEYDYPIFFNYGGENVYSHKSAFLINNNTLIIYKVNNKILPSHLPMLMGSDIINGIEVNQSIILQTILFDREYGKLIKKIWKEGKFD